MRSALIRLLCLYLALGCLRQTFAAQETVLYVAAGGNDAWSGTLPEANAAGADGPLASVDQALTMLRRLRKEGKLPGAATVRIRGIHRLDRPLVLTPEDSGTAEAPVTITAYAGEKPVLSGGRVISGWRKHNGRLWTADVPEAKTGSWCFRQLFVNGRRACRARTPNKGYLHVESLVDDKPGAPWNEGVDRFRFKPGDIRAWNDLNNVEVVVFHSWNTSRVRIQSVDESNRTVVFTGPTVFRPLSWDPDQRYYVENCREALDSPGEWFLDRASGRLYYWPQAEDDMAKAEVVAPVLGELLRFEGDADAGRPVVYVHVADLSFQHSDWELPAAGYGDPQAAVTVPAAVTADGARHCAIQRCEIAHAGTYGLWFRHGCKDNQIIENQIHDLGAGGIRLGEPTMAATDEAESSRNLVSNNYIHDGGQVYAGAVGFWLAQSSRNTISHNEIHSFDYSGMSIGWNWSDAPTRTLHNRIEHNHVHHVVRGVLSDAGGIYTLGTQTGTVVRGNIFHDIFPYMGKPAMAWGIYFDQGSNGLLVEKNLVYNTLNGGIMNTGNPGNTVRNNIFAHSAWHAAWRYQFQKEPATVVERNLFYLAQGELFYRDGGQSDFQSRWNHNLYWRTDGEPLMFYSNRFAEWQAKGADRDGVVADPRFVDADRYDFRLQPDSPALQLGFEPIDLSHCGLIGRAEWVNLPKQAVFAPTVLPPAPAPPAPVTVDDGFEDLPPGSPPGRAVVLVEGRGDAISVSEVTAAGGKKSLKLQDAPGLQHRFNPHLYYQPHFRTGTAVLSFDVRLEAGAMLAHEWRDDGQPYRVGPSLEIAADGKLRAAGAAVGDVPIGTWVHFEITSRLGQDAPGTYSLSVAAPRRPVLKMDDLRCGSEDFQQIEWLGFVSLADAETAIYLDNIKLELRANNAGK
ncbi:MAG: right-handed parallel beta-helix repeat-containing protein [Pirellulales bacterium]|nr:right-handed parallel beta-helix repeat-containing protein [Pirellulales bacterium]